MHAQAMVWLLFPFNNVAFNRKLQRGVADITNPGKRKGVADIVFYVNDILGNTAESHHKLPEAVYLIPHLKQYI